jgi:hypothetical protein
VVRRIAQHIARQNWMRVKEVASVYTLARREATDQLVFHSLKQGVKGAIRAMIASGVLKRPKKPKGHRKSKKHHQKGKKGKEAFSQFFLTEHDHIGEGAESGEGSSLDDLSEASASASARHRGGARCSRSRYNGEGAQEDDGSRSSSSSDPFGDSDGEQDGSADGNGSGDEDEDEVDEHGVVLRRRVQSHNNKGSRGKEKVRNSVEDLTKSMEAARQGRRPRKAKVYDPSNAEHK